MGEIIEGNLHTHTRLCRHARGEPADYCRAARRAGFAYLGFSDHTPLPGDMWKGVRMAMAELPLYLEWLDRARAEFADLRILRGMECEYLPQFRSLLADRLLGELALDYLIGAVHPFPHRGEWCYTLGGVDGGAALRSYADHYIATMEAGLFAFMAHPDMFGHSYLEWDGEAEACSRAMLAAAADLGMPLEINAYGYLKPLVPDPDGLRPPYPWRPFWELAGEYGIQVLVNSDAHDPDQVLGAMARGFALGRECGLEFVDPLSLVKGGGAAG